MEQAKMQEQLMLPIDYTTNMTPEIARKVEALKATIDVHDRRKVIAYGREQQASIGKFADSILQGVGNSELGEAGDLLAKVMGEINGYSADVNGKERGLFGFFKKQKSKLQMLQAKYRSLAENINIVVKDLQKKDFALQKVSSNLEVMYEENCKLYEFLTIVIYAGERALEEEKQKLIVMQGQAQRSNNPMEAQKVSDFSDDIRRFEKRLYDLKISRTIAMQQAPQIRLIQKGSDEMSESIKNTIVTAIPLWKTQMAMALGMQTIKEGLGAVGAVKDATNAMLVANAQQNKQLTEQMAQAAEKGIVDIDTINKVNQDLVETLAGSCGIAQKAITRREEEAKKLQESEAELKAAVVQYTSV